MFLGVYDNKSNVNQVLEINYIDSNCIFTKKIDFSEIIFAFSVTLGKKGGCGSPYPNATT